MSGGASEHEPDIPVPASASTSSSHAHRYGDDEKKFTKDGGFGANHLVLYKWEDLSDLLWAKFSIRLTAEAVRKFAERHILKAPKEFVSSHVQTEETFLPSEEVDFSSYRKKRNDEAMGKSILAGLLENTPCSNNSIAAITPAALSTPSSKAPAATSTMAPASTSSNAPAASSTPAASTDESLVHSQTCARHRVRKSYPVLPDLLSRDSSSGADSDQVKNQAPALTFFLVKTQVLIPLNFQTWIYWRQLPLNLLMRRGMNLRKTSSTTLWNGSLLIRHQQVLQQM